jgi:hypothetical protein
MMISDVNKVARVLPAILLQAAEAREARVSRVTCLVAARAEARKVIVEVKAASKDNKASKDNRVSKDKVVLLQEKETVLTAVLQARIWTVMFRKQVDKAQVVEAARVTQVLLQKVEETRTQKAA